MKIKYSKRLLSLALGMAFSANVMATAGAVDVASPLLADPAGASTEVLASGTSDPSAPQTTPPSAPPSATSEQQSDGSQDTQGPSSQPQGDDHDAPQPPVDTGDFVVQKLNGDVRGADYKFEHGCLTFLNGGQYVVSMKPNVATSTQHRIAVDKGFKGSITIDSLYVKVNEPTPVQDYEKPAIQVDGSAQLTLYLKGSNLLEAGADAAAIQFQNVTDTGYLTIEDAPDDGEGALTAVGGDGYWGNGTVGSVGGAGIGAQYTKATRNITINSGKVSAMAGKGSGCAGIGGGEGAKDASENIRITGGTVTAMGGESGGAGIGGGKGSGGMNIVISGGFVSATGVAGAGIGGGYVQNGDPSTIEITGGRVTAQSTQGDAIGSGLDGRRASESKIIIENASVRASSDQGKPFSVTPKNKAGKDLHLLYLDNFTSLDKVEVDGQLCSNTIPAQLKKELYLYLAAGQKVSYDGATYLTELVDGRLKLAPEQNNGDGSAQQGEDAGNKPAPGSPDSDSKPEQNDSSSGGSSSGGSSSGGSSSGGSSSGGSSSGGSSSGGSSSGGSSSGGSSSGGSSSGGGHSGGGHSGGGSSGTGSASKPQITHHSDGSTTETTKKSDGTTVETTKRPDGSKTIVETGKDKTVTKTDWDKQGNMVETVKNPDGSSTITEVRKDGTRVATKVNQKGNVSAEVKVPARDKKVTVMIPTPKQPAPSDVIVIVNPDGTEKVVSKTVPGEHGLIFSAQENVTIRVEDRSRTFADIPNEHWAERAVDFVTSRSLFNGINETMFAPNLGMTRGMLAVVLHNLEGNPASAFPISFSDVAENAWYKEGVQWAMKQDIVSGYGNGQFGADDPITREQLAVMLYRYSGSPSVSTQPLNFTDADQVSDYADRAMHWAVDQKIMSGVGDGLLEPKGAATRAQVAVMLTRLMESNAKENR